MADKKECDRCKHQAPFGTLKGWGHVEIRNFGADKNTERPSIAVELCPRCKEATIGFVNEPPPEALLR